MQTTDNPIRTLLHISDNGDIPDKKVVITNTTLASIDALMVIPAIILDAFNNNPIEITDAQANPITGNDDGDVIITGISSFQLSNGTVPATVTLKMINGNIQALFQFTMIEDVPAEVPWKFSDSFPSLPKLLDVSDPTAEPVSPLDELLMNNAQFLVSTSGQIIEGQDIFFGINFSANLVPTGILNVFETYIAGKVNLKLQGTVNIPAISTITPPLDPGQFPWDPAGVPPGINLQAGLGLAPFILGGMTFSADFFRVYSAASTEWFGLNNTYHTIVAYTGEFDIPSANSNIGVTAITPPGSESAMLIAGFQHSPIGNFSQLVDILGIDNVLGFFPQNIQDGDLGGLGIQATSVTIGYKNGLEIRDVSITIGMPELNWHIWPDHFEIASVSANFDIQYPFDSATRVVNILVAGQLEIEGVQVDISAQKASDFAVTASVPGEFDIPLSQLMTTYAPGIPPVSDLTINALELIVSPDNYYSIMLRMAQEPKPWIIPLGVTELKFSDVGLFLLKSANADLSGSFYGTAQIAGVTLTSQYDIPGDVIVRGDFPDVTLSDIVSFLTNGSLEVPDGFDLTFTQSYIILRKIGNDYKMELGTVIEEISSLAFVIEKGTTGWGVAVGLQIELDQLGKLSGGISDSVNAFISWFPFRTFTLAVSTLKDESFTFPGFAEFDESSLGTSKITLPSIASGIQPGFFLYTNTVFTKQNRILAALIDLLKIPEGTELDSFVAYLTEKKQFQLGISLSTFLTPVSDIPSRTCIGPSGYENGCLTGTIMVIAGGADDFAFALAASLKTIIQDTDVEFDVLLAVVVNGIFVSGTMKVEKPLTFGPVQLGGLAVELGISFEGLPSFGFSAELMVEDLFDSTLAVLINTENPAESMIAGALSNLTLGDVFKKLVGVVKEKLPPEIESALDEVSVKGSEDSAFEIPAGQYATELEDALNNFKGDVISQNFIDFGNQSSFPDTSDGMMIFNDAENGKWYITEQAGTGDSSTVTHWQLVKNAQDAIEVSKEAQFYFVPSPAGVNIGTFYYPQGMKISGLIQFLLLKVDVDIEIEVDKGLSIDAQMDKISLISDNLFSITAEEGPGGPQVSISTFTQPELPEKFRDPHFFINGKMTILGSELGIFINITESGAHFEVSGASLGGIFQGVLAGNFTAKQVDIAGSINVGIGSIDLGELGTWHIDTGVYANANIFANLEDGDAGAFFTAGFELGGDNHSIGEIELDVNVGRLSDLPDKFFNAVKEFLIRIFTDPKYWAEMAAKVLGWFKGQVKDVLVNKFGLSEKEAQEIISDLSAFCPIITTVGILGK
jgi:hypothetical protein